MSKVLWNTLLISPAVLGATLVVSSTAMAAEGQGTVEALKAQDASTELDLQVASEFSSESASLLSIEELAVLPATETSTSVTEMTVAPMAQPEVLAQTVTSESALDQLNRYSNEGAANTEGQVTSVSQLSDVQPTDWAFQALQSLVERYGCIAGYPDGTYRGQRAMTRYEFAAGLNACLDRISELIGSATADLVTREDLAALQRLQEEFAAELATLRGRVDALEARTAELEANQFSTTTKLTGEAIFALVGDFGDGFSFGDLGNDSDNQAVFQQRVRLNLNTSFTGRDLLLTRLQVGNAQRLALGATAEGTQTFNVFGDTENTFTLDSLLYQFPMGDRLGVTIWANAGVWDDLVPTVNPYFEDFDGGSGSLSALGQRNPIYRLGGGAGIGFTYDIGRPLGGLFGPTALSFGYLASDAGNPQEGNGIFNGDYSALAQMTFTPSRNIQMALVYNHSYFERGNFGFDNGWSNGAGEFGGFVGSGTANSLYGVTEGFNPNNSGIRPRKVVANSYGAQIAWALGRGMVVNAWGGLTQARMLGLGDSSLWTYGLNLGFPDLGKEGNLLGFTVGREPYLSKFDVPGHIDNDLRRDSSWHFETFYKFQVSDNISVTPGVIWITNPNQNKNNDDIIVGTLRTTFTF